MRHCIWSWTSCSLIYPTLSFTIRHRTANSGNVQSSNYKTVKISNSLVVADVGGYPAQVELGVRVRGAEAAPEPVAVEGLALCRNQEAAEAQQKSLKLHSWVEKTYIYLYARAKNSCFWNFGIFFIAVWRRFLDTVDSWRQSFFQCLPKFKFCWFSGSCFELFFIQFSLRLFQ